MGGAGLSTKDALLEAQIKAYDKYHKIFKAAEKQVESLKEWFKSQAGDADVIYAASDGTEVRVTGGEQTRYDVAKLDKHFGAKADKYKTTSPTKTVTIKRLKKTKSKKKAA